MLFAAKAMAVFGSKLLRDPKLVPAAKTEFETVMGASVYECPIPADLPIPSTK